MLEKVAFNSKGFIKMKMILGFNSPVESPEMLAAGGSAGQYAKCLVSKWVSEIFKVFNKKITQLPSGFAR